ncbi:MAG: adenine phosphoribosyltransferase [Chloroflexi bacterium]|nr:adenine phosphoribosyltransferase [Chloroflexota bacterium]
MDLKKWIRDIPDYPKPGILFRDLTPLLAHPPAFRHVIDTLVDCYRGHSLDAVAVIDARGFLFGGPVAYRLELPIVPLRKANKLPPETVGVEYALEYGKARMEMIATALLPGQRVLILDDLLATGGTAAAAAKLVEGRKATVGAFAFVVELVGLNGRGALRGYDITSLVQY